MDIEFEVKLIECLDALENHEPIDQILARYPHDALRLRPMLATASALPTLRMEPSEAVKAKSRDAFLSQAKALRQAPPRRTGFVTRILTTFVAVALVCIVLGVGAVAASGSSLPGDPLYGLKRAVENVRLSVADTASRGALAAQYERTRIDETEALVKAGRSSQVEFVGTIQSMQSNTWLVDKVMVQVNPGTPIEGEPAIGQRAHIQGITSPTGLQAISIEIETGNGPAPESTPRPTATTEPTSTVEPTSTTEPTPRPANTPRLVVTRTPVPAEPTAEPTTQPTTEPTEIEMTGDVQSISAQTWVIDSQTIEINDQTQINGNIAVGQRVKVKAHKKTDGGLVALQIELAGDTGGGNGNQNNNDNGNNNGNVNGNDNSNENHNGNDNSNHNRNSNDNSNSNDNHNRNDNGNTNSNQNTNDNSNSNDNHNGNDG